MYVYFLIVQRPTRSIRTDTPFPFTTLFRAVLYKDKGKDTDTAANLSVAVVPFAGRVNVKPHRDWLTTQPAWWQWWWAGCADERTGTADRKSTRLNSGH